MLLQKFSVQLIGKDKGEIDTEVTITLQPKNIVKLQFVPRK